MKAWDEGHWTLGRLINQLEKLDPKMLLETDKSVGICGPHSYRGYYQCLGLEPCGRPCTVGDTLELLQSVVGHCFLGWKGGSYQMFRDTPLFLAYEGACGPMITGLVWKYGTNRYVIRTEEDTII